MSLARSVPACFHIFFLLFPVVLPLLGIPLLDSVLGTVGGAAAGYNTVAYAGAPATAYGGQTSAYGTGYSARSNQV